MDAIPGNVGEGRYKTQPHSFLHVIWFHPSTLLQLLLCLSLSLCVRVAATSPLSTMLNRLSLARTCAAPLVYRAAVVCVQSLLIHVPTSYL
jgi:hypothetical protein